MPAHLPLTAHLAILSAVPAIAVALAVLTRYRRKLAKAVRFFLAGIVAINELAWYGYRLQEEGFRFPEALPLQLCDLTVWLTVLSALTLRAAPFEVAYFAGLSGSGMALLTPDLWAPFPSYPTIYFFLSHGFVVITLVTLTGARLIQPRPGSIWRAFGILNAYAAAVALFDAIFKTNYMYLCRKPVNASLLDYLGPWPVYILAGEAVTVLLFWLLCLPFRRPAANRKIF